MPPADRDIMRLLPCNPPLIFPFLSSIPATDPPIGRISLLPVQDFLSLTAHFAPGYPPARVSIHKY